MDEEDEVPGAGDGETLLYDFFKHLTSLSLLSLGGVLALSDKLSGRAATLLIGALGIIGVALIFSFTGSSQIVEARFKGRPLHKSIEICRIAAPILLSLGLGMFLYLFVKTLKM